MARKPAVPVVVPDTPEGMAIDALRQNVETITGVNGGPLTQLSTSATTDEIIAKINAIIARLNYTGS